MSNLEYELRSLMRKYVDRYMKIEKDRLEAEESDDTQGEMICDCLLRQNRLMTAELFQTMKTLGMLDEEEIKHGGINQ